MNFAECAGEGGSSQTREMAGGLSSREKARFVVHEHDASHLHHDFRLEIDGVLKSWAVPKGMPPIPNVRRLAVQTEDHPVEYIDFEGTIPEGEYGAGTVKIWDAGEFELAKESAGHLEVDLKGRKLSGRYVMVHTADKNWILFKKRAEDAHT